MVFLLDANVLIDAARDYYPIGRVPEFWAWLQHQGAAGAIRIPLEIHEEVSAGHDDLATWLRDNSVKGVLLLDEEVDPAIVARVVAEGYAPDLRDDEVQMISRDPFLVAYALGNLDPPRCIVTTERSKPSRTRANRHLPDVCTGFRVPVCDTFELLRRLDFRTNWRAES